MLYGERGKLTFDVCSSQCRRVEFASKESVQIPFFRLIQMLLFEWDDNGMTPVLLEVAKECVRRCV